jgi:hypothetical protein
VINAVYSVLTELPAVFVLYRSALWSGIFMLAIFAVSVWNGAGFYIDELPHLKGELREVLTMSRTGVRAEV